MNIIWVSLSVSVCVYDRWYGVADIKYTAIAFENLICMKGQKKKDREKDCAPCRVNARHCIGFM